MRIGQWLLLAVTILSAGCSGGSRHLTAARAAEVDKEVRAFAGDVAHGVTHEGPLAWRRYFADSPEFFMAVEGRLAFPNGASAMAAMPEIARTFKQIELDWGDDLRVDPLAPDLAVMAAPFHEIQTRAAGERVEENGYFTGITEYKGGRWQFRNAHWSVAVPPPAVR
jgi:hypothetical protein